MDMVTLKHPDLPGERAPFVTTRAAYDVTWADKGWQIVETPAAASGPPANLDSMTKADLETLAADRGVNLDGAQNNAERVAAIRSSYPEA
jgi:hypothetical protein